MKVKLKQQIADWKGSGSHNSIGDFVDALIVELERSESQIERLTGVIHNLDPIWAAADAAYERVTGPLRDKP